MLGEEPKEDFGNGISTWLIALFLLKAKMIPENLIAPVEAFVRITMNIATLALIAWLAWFICTEIMK